MRSPSPCRSAVSLSALFAFLLVCLPAAAAQTAPPPAATDAATTTPPASVQLSPLPSTEQFDKKIDFRTRPAGESLDALVQILARSVGLSAVTQGIPDTVARYDFGEPKPFREVWDIVLTLNGLEYVLRDNGIVVVGPPAALAGLQPQQNGAEPSVAVTYLVNSNPTQLQTLLESQFPVGSGVTVTAFEELGLISVRGMAAQQTRIKDILERFDRNKVIPVRRTYSLSYAKADALATVLLGTLTSNSQGDFTAEETVPDLCDPKEIPVAETAIDNTTGVAAGGGETSEDNQPPLSIFADNRTNRLIVTAPTQTQEEIVRLLKELDQPEKQVNVQVRIQEVSSDVSDRLGINLTSALGNFATTLFSGDVTSGLEFVFDAQKAVSGFNLGAVLDAFERQGLSRRVDDSNMTVINNGLATLRSGGNIEISLPSGGESNLIRTIAYGVLIGLSPQITNSEEIILDVCARVDTPITEITDPNLQNISVRRVGSIVTLEPGQTVVLGGLLQNQLNETRRGVPVLSDVPVIGNLFSTSSSTGTNTELLVIVTANVLE